VVPFPIACGACLSCQRGLYSLCENSNPNAAMAEAMFGFPTAGIFGYSHLTGGYAGGQAEYARVPFADIAPLKIESDLTDEQVLFLSDILPTGYMGAEMCDIKAGDVVAVWGAGPVGQFAAASASLLGAAKVIVIDRLPYRLEMARANSGAEVLNYEEVDVHQALKDLTGGRGRTPASTRSAWRPITAAARSTPTTGSSRLSASRPSGPTPCATAGPRRRPERLRHLQAQGGQLVLRPSS
jgi:threonine dehydrogenase-like Zn-dependent dehydrogenase